MKDCFSTLQNIAQSTEDLLADRYSSLESTEIKNSAGVLRSSLQPCLEEIERSALLLKTHLEACIVNLDIAEDVWQSKQRIAQIPTVRILEAIGKISGSWNRLQQEADELKADLIEQAKQIWSNEIEKLENHTFLGKNGQYRDCIGWDEKERFRNSLPSKLDYASKEINQLTNQALLRLYKSVDEDNFKRLSKCSEALDKATKLDYIENIVLEHFNQSDKYAFHLDLRKSFHGTVKEWKNRFGDISHKEVKNFKQRVMQYVEERISVRLDTRIDIRLQAVKKLVDYTIEFYHDFLIKQHRYQQETLEQQKSEQAWIMQQRHHLERLLTDLEQCLKA